MFDIPKFWQLNFVHQPISVDTLRLRVCLVPRFTQKILDFGPSFCRMEINTMQNFWQKGIHSPFWILASRGKKKSQKAKKPSPTP
jgi:hypothetical protein